MPNRLIKQIIAKLNGESTQETFDIYDDAAVHTGDVANNLTTTDAGYVLDARQGKVIGDSLTAVSTESVTALVTYVTLTKAYLRKNNGVVDINCEVKATSSLNAWTNACGIPIGFRPANTVNMIGVIGSTGDAVRVQVGSGGTINFGKALASNETIYFSGAYVSG